MAESIDLREWRKFNRDLKGFSVDKATKKALRQAGELIAADARVLVSPYSRTVPPSIKVRLRKTSIIIQAGGANVPMGGLLEMGNRSRSRSRSRFRHPVFGHDVWVEQDMHPYLLKATEKNMRPIEHFEGQIVAEAFREAGWHGA